MNPSEFVFPTGFLWGSATSAHQVEGNNLHSDWWAWEQAGRVKERSGLACDHYRRFADDFDLAASLGHNTHRCSIEWSRLEPAEGRWDDAALAHYVEVVRALRVRRLEPMVTLHHFTTPQWLAEQGGWANPKVVEAFARYVTRVRDALGGLVRYWITINEPMVFVRMHYLQGLGPPGVCDLKQGIRVLEHMLRAHAAAYHLLHETRVEGRPAPCVSVAQYVPVFRPCHWWSPLDRGVARAGDRIFNGAVFDTLTLGRLAVPGVLSLRIPDAAHTLDFVGVNFYGRQFVHAAFSRTGLPGEGCDLGHHPKDVTERTEMGWDVHPDSLAEVLTRLRRMGLPILVTENGTFMADDARRWSFLERHVQAMARAMQAGAPVIGYYYWSLLDNFEWADGFGPRFGLIEIDYASQQRRVRDSARRYAAVCEANRIRV